MDNRKTIKIILGGILSLVGLLAGLAELTGYSLRDLFSEKEQGIPTGVEALTGHKDTPKPANSGMTRSEAARSKTTPPPEPDRTAAFIGSWYDITYAPESRNLNKVVISRSGHNQMQVQVLKSSPENDMGTHPVVLTGDTAAFAFKHEIYDFNCKIWEENGQLYLHTARSGALPWTQVFMQTPAEKATPDQFAGIWNNAGAVADQATRIRIEPGDNGKADVWLTIRGTEWGPFPGALKRNRINLRFKQGIITYEAELYLREGYLHLKMIQFYLDKASDVYDVVFKSIQATPN